MTARWSERLHRFFEMISTAGGSILTRSRPSTKATPGEEMIAALRAENERLRRMVVGLHECQEWPCRVCHPLIDVLLGRTDD